MKADGMNSQRLIVIDWGISSFRAYLVDLQSGECLDEIPQGQGMRLLERHQFAGYCADQLARWRRDAPDLPVYMAGMVGAAQGWATAPQLTLPVDAAMLARHLIPAPGLERAWILPGARWFAQHEDGDEHDVMRGEEVQIFGALALAGVQDAVLCLPGSHSKWARVHQGRLVWFHTAMTGEVYDMALSHSLLGRPADRLAAFSADAFNAGLRQVRRAGGLLHHLFTARAAHLYGGLGPKDIPSYISGLLIGDEIQGLSAFVPSNEAVPLWVVCAPRLWPNYQMALEEAGYQARWIDTRLASLGGIQAVAKAHQATMTVL